MKTIILVLGLTTAMATTAFSQTKLIALRSRSGTNAEFDPSEQGNYGEIIMRNPDLEKRNAFEKALRDSIAKVNADSARKASNAQRSRDSVTASKNRKGSKKRK